MFDTSKIPKGLMILQNCGQNDYYLRFGISKIIKLPYKDLDEYLNTHEVNVFK